MRDIRTILKTVDIIFLDMNDMLYKRGFFDAQKLQLGREYLQKALNEFFDVKDARAVQWVNKLCQIHKYPMMAIDALAKQFPAHQGLKRFHEAHYAPYWKVIENVDYSQLSRNPMLRQNMWMLQKLDVRFSINTNSYKDEAKAILEAMGLKGLFDHVIFGEKLYPHGKYTVEGFQLIKNIVQPKAQQVLLFIDDDPAKLQLAKQAFGQDAYTVLLRNDLFPHHIARRAAKLGHELPTKRSELPVQKPEGVDAYARSLELVLDYVIQHKSAGRLKI